MTTTQTLQLSTWAPEDNVNLTQMNQNFLTLDQEATTVRVNDSQHKTALNTLLCNAARDAAYRYHAGQSVGHLQNVFARDFSKTGQVSSYTGMYYDGAYLKRCVGYSGETFTPSATTVNTAGVQLGSFTPKGYGTLTQVSGYFVPDSDYNSYVQMTVVCGGKTLATVRSNDLIVHQEDNKLCHFNLNLAVEPEKQYELKFAVVQSLNNTLSVTGTFTVTATPTNTETGYFTTSTPLEAGSNLSIWLCHTGTAPAMQYRLGDGNWTALTPAAADTCEDFVGTACSRERYELTGVSDATLQLQVAVSSANTVVRELYGALL